MKSYANINYVFCLQMSLDLHVFIQLSNIDRDVWTFWHLKATISMHLTNYQRLYKLMMAFTYVRMFIRLSLSFPRKLRFTSRNLHPIMFNKQIELDHRVEFLFEPPN